MSSKLAMVNELSVFELLRFYCSTYWLQHQKIFLRTCAPSEDSDQLTHSHSLLIIFAGCILNSQWYKVSSSAQRRLWSDCTDTVKTHDTQCFFFDVGYLFTYIRPFLPYSTYITQFCCPTNWTLPHINGLHVHYTCKIIGGYLDV